MKPVLCEQQPFESFRTNHSKEPVQQQFDSFEHHNSASERLPLVRCASVGWCSKQKQTQSPWN